MKKHTGGLARFLNDETQQAARHLADDANRIVYIDIDNIVSNPRNFYGLRDIDSLAGLIAVSHMVEPLIVCPEEDGKYMLLSGHRRRAAVQKLLDDGDYEERKLPCIIHERRKITIPQENGEEIVFDESDVDLLHLIASNRGQRKERTMDEKLSEVKYLEPFARAVFAQKRKEHGKGMVFRKFFAEEILDISSSKLQRLEAIKKMSEKVKTAVESGYLRESSAVRLSGMPLEQQDEVMAWLEENGRKGTMQDVEDAIKAVQPKKPEMDSRGNEAQDELVSSATEDSGEESTVMESDTIGEEAGTCCDENGGDGSEDLPDSRLPHHRIEDEEDVAFLPDKNPGVSQLMDVPDSFDNPQKEAEDWFRKERLAFYRSVYGEAKHLSESEPNERKAAQWGIRASVARYHIAELMEKK